MMGHKIGIRLIVAMIGIVTGNVALAQDQWGDIPEHELENTVLYDFIKGTPEEKKTIEVLRFLDVSTKLGLRAVFYVRSGKTDRLPDSQKGVSIIMEDCSLDLAAHSREIIHYQGYNRLDVIPRSKIAFSDSARDEAVAIARTLGGKMGFDLSTVEERARLDGGAIWEIDFYQIFNGYLCPSNVFSVEVDASSKTVCSVFARPFITKGQAKVNISKSEATSKACAIAKERHSIYKGRSGVEEKITVDKPHMYPVGVDRNKKGLSIGQIGRLAWPVYMEGSTLIIYVDCETGDILRTME